MLAAFLLYGIGSSIAMTAAPGALLTTAIAMMLLNSVAVIAIGALMLRVLRTPAPAIAIGYLITRIFEGAFLAVGAIALLNGFADTNFLAYNIAMAGLGFGSLFFCVALYRSRLVPRFLAAWGFIGYASFATGCILELSGVAGAGLISTIPGGLFEVFFAIWLIAGGVRCLRKGPRRGLGNERSLTPSRPSGQETDGAPPWLCADKNRARFGTQRKPHAQPRGEQSWRAPRGKTSTEPRPGSGGSRFWMSRTLPVAATLPH
ncbi:hypothetical protein BH11ACT4_BH11ACT4_06970 [soil metagenome]